MDLLTILVEAYENEYHPIELPDPIEAVKVRMDDLGLGRDDFCAMLGVGSGRISELLTRRRHLTLDMIRTLSAALSLPEACLLQQYDLVPASPQRGLLGCKQARPGKLRDWLSHAGLWPRRQVQASTDNGAKYGYPRSASRTRVAGVEPRSQEACVYDEAFGLYEANWRHLNRGGPCPGELRFARLV